MEWLLILTLTVGGATERMPVGVMVSAEACALAGAGMVAALRRANPDADIHAQCVEGRRV